MSISLTVARPFATYSDWAQRPVSLELAGAHQEQNASLAVALAASWEASPRGGAALADGGEQALQGNVSSALSNGHSPEQTAVQSSAPADAAEPSTAVQRAAAVQAGRLPAPYLTGLRDVSWPGRNQVHIAPLPCAPDAVVSSTAWT